MRTKQTSRGFTVLELLLALTVTAFVGLGIASMLAMVRAGAAGELDRRSILLRAHAAQRRLRAYISPALNIPQMDPDRGVVLWLHDEKPMNNIHMTELRVVWYDAGNELITVERVKFPEAMSQVLKDQLDLPYPASTDFFTLMEDQRALGYTTTETLVDDVMGMAIELSDPTPASATRLYLTLTLRDSTDQDYDVLLATGLSNHTQPAF